MFIRQYLKNENGKQTAYWALVESYRTDRGPRQRIVAWLGKLDKAGRLGVRQAAQLSGTAQSNSDRAHPATSPGTAAQLQFEFDDEADAAEPRWVEVNVAGVRVENLRHFGGPWLAMELIRRLKLDEFLQRVLPRGQETIPWSFSSLILVVARLLEPSSELYTAEQWYPKTALPELLGVPRRHVDDNRLYRTLDRLLPHKAELEAHLKTRLGELFDLEYDLLLYDVTSTYFEGKAEANPLAQRGYSRDQRSDCKQVCIGLVVSRCGMPLGYEVFAGNTADVTTVEQIVTTMEQRYGKSNRVWVMDRGMVSAENIAFLKRENRRYIIGTPKSMLKKFEQELLKEDWHTIRDGLEVKLCPLPPDDDRDESSDEADADDSEVFILCRSRDRFQKESDLSLRPIWHQKQERVQAHILVCFLAYVLWKTLAGLCERAGLGDEPRRVLSELSEIRLLDVVLPTRTGLAIRTRCISKPSDHQQILLDHLNLRMPSKIKQIEM